VSNQPDAVLPFFDILLVLPLEEEMKEVLQAFEIEKNLTTPTQLRYALKAISGISVVAVLQEEMGYSGAAKACTDAYANYRFNMVITCGIAGSLSNDIGLGDVCYTGTLFDVFNNAKVSDAKKGGIIFESSPDTFQTSRRIAAALSFIRVMPDINRAYFDWSQFQGLVAADKCPDPVVGRSGAKEKVADPIAVEGALACGHVTKSESYNSALRAIHRNMLAVETESGAVFRFCQQYSLECLTIRGISDYANRLKGKLEQDSEGAVRTIAASNACSFLRLQFENPYFVEAVQALRTPDLQDPVPLVFEKPENPLPEMLEQITSEIDAKLRELSPEYRSKPLGYRLPTPRIRGTEQIAAQFEVASDDLEIWDALRRDGSLLLRIPRNSPDRSLAWVIANELLSREIDGVRVLPVTVGGQSLAPPKKGIARMSGVDIGAPPPPGSRYVVIIDGLPLTAPTRLKYIIDEVNSHPEVLFIALAEEDKSPIAFKDFAARTSFDLYDTGQISFSEIANFLQRHYEMPGTTAEVVAYQLHRVFDKYKLQVNPTFFAGVPAEALIAILEANARAELIQLAVFGYLTMVVAGDTDKVRVNRTTRLDFLRKLVREIKVEKRPFTQAALITFADEFSNKFALGLQPIKFISGFFDVGILRMDGNAVQFSLPFVEAYVLALELSEDPQSASAYFDPWADDFDFMTFDFYSEISANSEIPMRLDDALDEAVAKLDGRASNVVFSGDIKTPLDGGNSVKGLEKGLRSAEATVRSSRSELVQKQQVLDAFGKITRGIKAELGRMEGRREDEDVEESLVELFKCVQVWQVSVTLLGSGAERIISGQKASLAGKVLVLADRLIDHWTRAQIKIDYSEVRQ
jgi:nucleoside phosphorylase